MTQPQTTAHGTRRHRESSYGPLHFQHQHHLGWLCRPPGGIADNETHAHFTALLDEAGVRPWGRTTYEMMESYWPAVARGEVEAPTAMREWTLKLEAAN